MLGARAFHPPCGSADLERRLSSRHCRCSQSIYPNNHPPNTKKLQAHVQPSPQSPQSITISSKQRRRNQLSALGGSQARLLPTKSRRSQCWAHRLSSRHCRCSQSIYPNNHPPNTKKLQAHVQPSPQSPQSITIPSKQRRRNQLSALGGSQARLLPTKSRRSQCWARRLSSRHCRCSQSIYPNNHPPNTKKHQAHIQPSPQSPQSITISSKQRRRNQLSALGGSQAHLLPTKSRRSQCWAHRLSSRHCRCSQSIYPNNHPPNTKKLQAHVQPSPQSPQSITISSKQRRRNQLSALGGSQARLLPTKSRRSRIQFAVSQRSV